ncbi:MAG: TetR/AcrR family transcriptional regulator [Pseudonocardia sp.]|nr:TetR/AcrR family transcriptional regulator [Pseudonocardia sp.]
MARRKRLTEQDWVAAGYAALAEGGVVAVAVEPVASRLGATKGSFYWHFACRDALLGACLAHWERTDTDEIIALVAAESDVSTRLRTLLTVALGAAHRAGGTVELALQPSADHPLVAPVLRRVTQRRLDYLAAQFRALGFTPDEARQRSTLAYTAYLGHAQLAHATPDLAPSGPAYVDTVVARLTAR